MQYGSRLEDHTCAACYKPLSIPAQIPPDLVVKSQVTDIVDII